MSALTQQTVEIAGEPWTIYRTRVDQPYAEVCLQRGERRPTERPDMWINTQYGVHPDRTPVAPEFLEAARAFQAARHEAEKAASESRTHYADAVLVPPAAVPADAATRYQGQASIDAEDSIF